MTLHERLARARAELAQAGVSAAEATVDVNVYAGRILGWDRATIIAEMHQPMPPSLEPTFGEWVLRRTRREPTAYIIGEREFWGRAFGVTPAVLIPRPETELVIEAALDIVGSDTAGDRSCVADIGTGSGCLAVSLACELPGASVLATDVSRDALLVARSNAVRHQVSARVMCVQTSYLTGVETRFDLIVANPPYVRDGDEPGLSREVTHEPSVALFGGEQGLRDLAGVLDAAIVHLRDGGWLVMEFGFGQEDAVNRLVQHRPPLRLDHVRRDLQGLARTAIIERS